MSTKKREAELAEEEYEAEIDHRESSLFWSGLCDLDSSCATLLKMFAIRLAITLVQVHWRNHPDEIL